MISKEFFEAVNQTDNASLRSEFRVVMSAVRCPQINNVRFHFPSRCLREGSCLIYALCVCLSIVVSDTYCDVFLFCLSSSCVLYVGSFSALSISYCLFGIFYRLLINTNTRGINHPVDLKILSQLYCIKWLLFKITQSEVLKKIVLTS
jgi:hypothetical protein